MLVVASTFRTRSITTSNLSLNNNSRISLDHPLSSVLLLWADASRHRWECSHLRIMVGQVVLLVVHLALASVEAGLLMVDKDRLRAWFLHLNSTCMMVISKVGAHRAEVKIMIVEMAAIAQVADVNSTAVVEVLLAPMTAMVEAVVTATEVAIAVKDRIAVIMIGMISATVVDEVITKVAVTVPP